MNYYIYKNDQNLGPMPESDVAQGLRNGRFLTNDLGCRVGESEWKDLSFFFPLETSAPVNSLPRLEQPTPPVRNPVHSQPWQNSQPPMVVYEPPSAHSMGGMSDVGKLMLFESGKKSTTTAVLLCIFLGALGVHRFYLGHSGSGAAMLIMWFCSILLMFVFIGFLTIWITPIWAFVDLFLISGMVKQHNDQLAMRLGVFN